MLVPVLGRPLWEDGRIWPALSAALYGAAVLFAILGEVTS
jgi:hypothetical protein